MHNGNPDCEHLREGETIVGGAAGEWLRACLRRHFDPESGVASSMMFHAGSNDNFELSGAHDEQTTARELERHQREDQGQLVAGVWGIALKNLTSEGLHVHDDSAILPGPPSTPQGHAWLDLKHLPSGKGNPARRARERLRNWLLDNADRRVPEAEV